MNKKRIIKLVLLFIIIVIFNTLTLKKCNLVNDTITVTYNLISDKQDVYQVFYGTDIQISEEKSEKASYEDLGKEEELKFIIPKDTNQVRLDLGNQPAQIKLSKIKLESFWKSVSINLESIINSEDKNQIQDITKQGENIIINTDGTDPYVYINLDKNSINALNDNFNFINLAFKIALCFIIDITLLILVKIRKSLLSLVLEVKNNRVLIWNLAKNDFKTKYAGSYLGVIWAFIQPIITVLVYWFVFQIGLRSTPMGNFPFVLWLIAGLVPWFFFSDALQSATNSLLEYSYLVKKVVFEISILPVVKVVSAFFVHVFFLIFAIILYKCYGYEFNVYILQTIYYTFCMCVFVLAIAYSTCSIVIFFRDLGQVIGILLQIGVWLTPIMWSVDIIPKDLKWIFSINPMFYVVQGYRDSLISHTWFWERTTETFYFWSIVGILFALGVVVFKKLKIHFPDVI
ncbi:MAG: ABC-type polysaccharide/polyol phosphate export system, permease component [Clostridiaceae bacterium]|jgi:teichoic acid transport system permease protein|nr:ABC-type polysaccharide/polyol phosphate export system, permease component [Clostridiaceae bacterium]